ncbi:type II toxin-antitoxin system RatA family toxin [Amylibacter sp.]|jgi:coenzyme Q-binding protein COQ10|nr:type II toxin-antitoxin system RatA family toxin [Rhodobacterales bacterium]MCO4797139.1 type II toxin-antitoxin system RatA family toxin [Amylibacter sp.]MBT4134411.1 type II toxin-antitoxin system RatA family toxin [Rhodobacterales bacterium]MBT4322505.1 type II toxin-antitoxin system RatA family toxin [Rhodobacterales bacterium]MBT4470667.1 type II toxin-antitoxin system RatA family toxin [Rhodobacterales bacterium]|tara:strand:+ start:5922 stop:6365 length:444 start_codon:yes stop_codon:yes gene_type:complete
MPTHTEKRIMPYTAKQMYDLVADVETYPDFLPWCAATRIRKVTKDSHKTIIEADLIIAFKVFRERFGSRVTLKAEKFSIDVEYLDGPFKYLNNHWIFRDVDGGCEADFFVDFEFKSRVLQALIGVVFNEAMQRIVKAFEMRADDLYK